MLHCIRLQGENIGGQESHRIVAHPAFTGSMRATVSDAHPESTGSMRASVSDAHPAFSIHRFNAATVSDAHPASTGSMRPLSLTLTQHPQVQ